MENYIGIIVVISILAIGFITCLLYISLSRRRALKDSLSRMKDVSKKAIADAASPIPFSIDTYIATLGSDYMVELLKSGELKYTWKQHQDGASSSYKGIRNYKSAKTYRISIYVKDNKITRTSGLNLE